MSRLSTLSNIQYHGYGVVISQFKPISILVRKVSRWSTLSNNHYHGYGVVVSQFKPTLSQYQQALFGALAAKAINAMLLDAETIITSVLLQLTIVFDAYLVDLEALKDMATDRQTDRRTDGLTDICISRAAFAAENQQMEYPI